MKNKKIIVSIIAAVLVALGVNLEKFGIDLNALIGGQSQSPMQSSQQSSQPKIDLPGVDLTKISLPRKNSDGSSNNTDTKTAKRTTGSKLDTSQQWSKTKPAVNQWHVFHGEINRKGNPVGYHSRPGGKDHKNARLVRLRDKPNRLGVYTAMIEVRDGGNWKEKFSSFFPDSLSESQVVEAILNAYQNSRDKKKQPWRGPSGLGFDVQGYTLSRGDINTAFPVFVKGK